MVAGASGAPAARSRPAGWGPAGTGITLTGAAATRTEARSVAGAAARAGAERTGDAAAGAGLTSRYYVRARPDDHSQVGRPRTAWP